MAQQTINLGSAANDGTGDSLRDGGDKINDNFTELYAADTNKQPIDADLTAIAALTPSNDDIIQRKAGAWTNRTIAQLRQDLGASYVLFSSAIPFVMPSSGSIGNNGALTGIAALPLTQAHAYLYFPANAIAAGSAAGWYYTVMSSTTAGTIYDNAYTSGVPAIPGSPTAFVTTGPGAYTQTTSLITGATLSVPANTLGPSGFLRITPMWSWTANANAKTHTITWGGTTIFSRAETTGGFHKAGITVQNRGVTNAQLGQATGLSGGFGGVTGSPIQPALDTTTALDILLKHQLGNAADSDTLEGFVVEAFYGA